MVRTSRRWSRSESAARASSVLGGQGSWIAASQQYTGLVGSCRGAHVRSALTIDMAHTRCRAPLNACHPTPRVVSES